MNDNLSNKFKTVNLHSEIAEFNQELLAGDISGYSVPYDVVDKGLALGIVSCLNKNNNEATIKTQDNSLEPNNGFLLVYDSNQCSF